MPPAKGTKASPNAQLQRPEDDGYILRPINYKRNYPVEKPDYLSKSNKTSKTLPESKAPATKP